MSLTPLVALCSLSTACPGAQEEVHITWQGRDLAVAELAKQHPEAAAVAKRWSGFAERHGYRLVLSDNRRVLLVLSGTYGRRNAATTTRSTMLSRSFASWWTAPAR